MANAKNYELLEKNRSSALEFVERIPKEQTAKPKALHQIPKSLNSIEDLTAAIIALNEQKDNNLGIFWREKNNHRIRDARYLKENPEDFKKDAGEKYAMQILNEVRGGILLIEQSDITDKETAKAKLLLIAEKSLKEIDELPTKIKIYNSALVEVLETSGIKDAAEQLNFAKEIASFKDEHKNIITLNKIEGKTVIEADVMLNGLTDSQEEQYTKIANNTIPDFTPAKLSATDRVKKLFGQYKPKEDPYAWYKELPKYKRDLIKGVAGDIASGKKVIPAQLRELIGLRNAYEKTTAIIKEDGKAKILVQGIHCGAPASKNKHNKDDITKENIKQLQSFTPKGSKLNLNILSSLTSKIPFFKKQGIRGENWITNRLKKASKEDKEVSISASPINRFRLLGGGREQKAFDQALKNIAENLESNETYDISLVKEYLKTGKGDFQEAVEQIKGLNGKEADFKIGLMAALNARKNLNDPNSLLGENLENTNVEISADMLIVQQSLNNGLLGGVLDRIKNAIITFCKSGKDRTGLVMLKASQRALQYELDLNGTQSKDVLLKLAQGGHTQEMAGIQGGSIGNHSIKTSGEKYGVRGEFILNEADEHIQKIISQKSSGFNSEIKQVDSSFFNRIINQAKFKKDKKATKKLINEIDTESQKKKATEVKKPTNTEYLPLPVTPYNKTTNTERQISG